MSDADRVKWEARYAADAYADRKHPTRWLADRLGELPGGRALDIACGAGRNALFLAEAGYQVDAIDISATGLARAAALDRTRAVNWIEADLESEPLPERAYDLIVLVRYVNRALLADVAMRLKPGGYLLAEQHLATEADVIGPGPRHRFAPNELLEAARGLRVLEYREGLVIDPDGRRAALAQLMACRPPAVFDISASGSA